MQTLIDASIIIGTIGVIVGMMKLVDYIKKRNTVSPISLYMPTCEEVFENHIERLQLINHHRAIRDSKISNIDSYIDYKKTVLATQLHSNKFKSYSEYSAAYDELMNEKTKLHEEIYQEYERNIGINK